MPPFVPKSKRRKAPKRTSRSKGPLTRTRGGSVSLPRTNAERIAEARRMKKEAEAVLEKYGTLESGVPAIPKSRRKKPARKTQNDRRNQIVSRPKLTPPPKRKRRRARRDPS